MFRRLDPLLSHAVRTASCTGGVGAGREWGRTADTAGKTLTTREINSTHHYFFVSLTQVSKSQARVSSWANLICIWP